MVARVIVVVIHNLMMNNKIMKWINLSQQFKIKKLS